MPIEAKQLHDQPCHIKICPICGHKPFEPFMRGCVQRRKRSLNIFKGFPKQDYCCLICSICKSIVGYESPHTEKEYIEIEQKELDSIPKNRLPLYITKEWKYEANRQRFLERLKNPMLQLLQES